MEVKKQSIYTPKDYTNIVWFVVWNIVDLISTLLAFSNSAIESNPVPKLFATSTILFIFYKIFGSLLITYILYKLHKTNWLIIPSYFLMAFSIWNMLIAVGVIK